MTYEASTNTSVHKTKLVGEIGLSHEGSLGLALSMIDQCKEAGLDYAKFQFHSSFHESTLEEDFRVKIFPQDETRRDYWDRTSFTSQEWREVINHCNKVRIGFLCTPFSVYAAQELKNWGIQELKIGSGDTLNFEILDFAKENFSRILVSLGMCNSSEIIKLRNFFQDYSGELVFMQCTSEYPASTSDVGLKMIRQIQSLGVVAGLSDHTGNSHVPMSAIAAGASFVEFHVIFDKAQFGPDSEASLTFKEALEVSNFRDTWFQATDQSYDKDEVSDRLQSIRDKFGRGVAVKRNVAKGEVLTKDLFTLKKPRGPISWEEIPLIVNKRAKKDISPEVHLKHSDLE